MTLLEYVTSLQDTGLSQEEIFAKAQEFKGKTKPAEVEVNETPVEEVKTEVVAEEDATAATTPEASKAIEKITGQSKFGTGPSPLPDPNQSFDLVGRTVKQISGITPIFEGVDLNPGETKKANKYEFKYEIGENKQPVFYTKPEDQKDWINVTANKAKNPGAELGVAEELGFNVGNFDREKELQRKKIKKDFEIGDILSSAKLEAPKPYIQEVGKFLTPEEIEAVEKSKKFRIAIGVEQLDLDNKISDSIYENNLDVDNFYSQFKDKDYSGKYVQDLGPDIYKKTFEDFNPDKINNFTSSEEFLGFLQEKGYMQDYIDTVYGPGLTLAEGDDIRNFQIAKQRKLDSYFKLYIQEANSKYTNQVLLSYIVKNKEKFKNVKSLSEAYGLSKKHFEKEYGQSTFEAVSYNDYNSYREEQFPEMVSAEKKLQAAKKAKSEELIKEGSSEGLLQDGFNKFYDGVMSRATEQAYELREALGFDMGYAKILDTEENIRKSAEDVRYGYIEGKKAEVDNVEYIKDSNGNIYNVTNKVAFIPSNAQEFEKVNKAIEDSDEKGSSFSAAGSTEQFLATSGTMLFDIAQIYGLGKFTKATKLGKITNAIKIPKASFDTMSYYTFAGYVSSKKNIYNELISAGVNETEAKEVAEEGARVAGVWTGATSLIAPVPTYLKQFDKILGNKSILQSAIKGYKKNGPKGFFNNFKETLKNIKITKEGAIKTGVAGLQEFGQEQIQQYGEITGVNSYVNRLLGKDVLSEIYSRQDFVNTGIVSFASGSAFANLNIPGFKPSAAQQLNNLYVLGKDTTQTQKLLNEMVAEGKATQEEVGKVISGIRSVKNQMSRIPTIVSAETKLESARLQQDISDLQTKKSRIDEVYHSSIDSQIDAKKKELAEIVKPELEKAAARKGAKIAAEQLGSSFENFKSQESIDKRAEDLKKDGWDVQDSTGYGMALTKDDKKLILINDQASAEDNVYTTDQHEVLHPFWQAALKANPEAAVNLGKSLIAEIVNNKDITGGFKFMSRFQSYLVDEKYSAQNTWDEVIPLVSEALSNGDIKYNPKKEAWWKNLGNKITNFLKGNKEQPLNLEFNTGKDVFDFIKGYNETIESGKGLTEQQLKVAKEGAKGKLIEGELDVEGLGAKVVESFEGDMRDETSDDSVSAKASKKDTGAIASTKVQEIYDAQGVAGAFDIIEQFKPIVKKIVDKRQDAPNFDRQLLTDEIETGKRGILDLIRDYKPESGVPLAAFINTQLNNRAIEASRRVLGETFTEDVTEARGVAAEEVTTEVTEKPVARKIKPSSFISNEAVTKIKEQVQEKIKGIDPKNLTFKKLGDLAPEIIAAEIGIPVKKLTDPKANLSKGDATAIQQFVNKNADKLLKILPEGAVIEAATEKLLGTSTGVPKGLLNAFYTKQDRLGKGAGLAPFKLNKGISKADFLKTFGIVEGKKAEGFDARSPQAQALKGIASLYGKLVTNEIVRSDTDLSLEAKQDVAAGKNKAMASKRFDLAKAKDISSTPFVVELVKKITTRTTSRGKEVKIKVTDLDSKEMQEFTSIVNSFLSKYPQHGPYFRQGYTGTKQTHTYGEVSIFDEYVPGFKGVKKPITRLGYSKSRFQSAKTINNAIPTLKADNKARIGLLKDIALDIEAFLSIKGNENKGYVFDQFFKDGSRDQNHPLRYLIPLKFATVDPISLKIITNEEVTEEHTSPVVGIGRLIMDAAKNGNVEQVFTEVIEPSAAQGGLLRSIDENMSSSLKQDQANEFYEKVLQLYKEGKLDSVKDALWYIRYSIENDVNPFSIMLLENGITVGEYFLGKTDISKVGLVETQSIANNLINDILTGKITQKQAKQEFKIQQENLLPGKVMASKRDSDLIPNAIKYDRPITVQTAINALAKTDKSLELARKLDQPVKKIRVFDFDDTLARTKSNVLYTMPDGTTGAIDAATFAKEAGRMEAEGAQWDFSEFSKVMQGSKGPLLDVAKIIADKRGTKDVFVLTARPANAAGPIKEFLASMGLDIPLANITGLGDGTPEAKAGWIMGKAAEGYNDFYFADDHTGNVKAVKDVLSQIDVKSKVQLAKASKRQTFDTVVNDMIEDSSGIEAYKKYSAARAKTVGASKGKYAFLIPPSAEDFTGLLYKMVGKGKKGDAQMAFLKTNLLDTYNRAESAVTQAKISAANDFVALKTKLKTLPKTLSKETGIGKFTYSHAVRVAAWAKQGMDIPGLSKRDVKELNDFVNKDAKLRVFTDELIKIQKGKEYPKPDKEWLGGNITTDIIGGINKVNRAEYQQEWRENIDIIFSEDNMNKMEAAYGSRWREAMEDSIRRMKSGSNRPIGGNRVTEGLLNWLNNSVGAVMFLNTRSALLQTISAVNFINLGDNNIIKAGRAFANQKQFWGDFMTLMNSDYLVERRNGLKINVSESEIADAVRESKNKPKAAIAFLLSKGFVMTRFADSFAIASGGSTFYRNRLEALKKQGLSDADAAQQAFEDFKAIAEENQQSSSPSKISQQQASAAGRVILAWANTPMQYARIQKRAAQDLINGRGDWRSNVSKIVYYGVIQNLIFNSLQQAVFALGFGDDEEETDEAKAKKRNDKAYKIANGMIDSQLKGLGIFGAASAAIKNTLMTLYEEYGKKGSKYENAVDDLLSFSPPLGSKIGKIKGGLRSFSWNMEDMKEKGFSLDNPAYMAGAQIVTGFTNIPLDRVAKKINNLRGLVNERSSLWQKVALGLGWGTWELGLGYYGGWDKKEPLTPKQELQLEVDKMKKDTSKPDQVKTLLDFGLTKKQIRELKNENNRVKKILELQKKDKK